jgi:hypothetical protein
MELGLPVYPYWSSRNCRRSICSGSVLRNTLLIFCQHTCRWIWVQNHLWAKQCRRLPDAQDHHALLGGAKKSTYTFGDVACHPAEGQNVCEGSYPVGRLGQPGGRVWGWRTAGIQWESMKSLVKGICCPCLQTHGPNNACSGGHTANSEHSTAERPQLSCELSSLAGLHIQ